MLVYLLGVTLAFGAQDTVRISLGEATTRAMAVSPELISAHGAVAAPRGARAELAWPFPSAPLLTFSRANRTSPTTQAVDRSYSIRQEIDVTGRSFVLAGAAAKRITAAESRVEDASRVVIRDTELAFLRLWTMERRAALLDSAAQTSERLAEIGRIRLEAGAIDRLEANAVLVDAGRQRSMAERAAVDRAGAAAELGRILNFPADSVLRTTGLDQLQDVRLPPLAELIAGAVGRRPDLAAAEMELIASDRDVVASRLGLLPRLEIGYDWGNEAIENLRGFSVGVRVPLFQRNQAERGAMHANRVAAGANVEATRRGIAAEISDAYARWNGARAVQQRLAQDVLRAASDNVALSQRALEEGRIAIPDVLFLRSVAVAAQIEYLNVVQDMHAARFALAAALGVRSDDLQSLGEIAP